jgi:hypothetical protein
MLDIPNQDLASRCQCSGEIFAGFNEFAHFMRSNYERELMFEEAFAVYRLSR